MAVFPDFSEAAAVSFILSSEEGRSRDSARVFLWPAFSARGPIPSLFFFSCFFLSSLQHHCTLPHIIYIYIYSTASRTLQPTVSTMASDSKEKKGDKLDMEAPTGDKLRVVSDKKGGSVAVAGGGECMSTHYVPVLFLTNVYILLPLQTAA